MIKLTFLGTRGNTKVPSAAHRMHSSLLVSSGGARVMINCGADWLGRFGAIAPDAMLITHAHRDHALGLTHGAPRPVYATAETWHPLDGLPIDRRQLVIPCSEFTIGFFRLEAWSMAPSARPFRSSRSCLISSSICASKSRSRTR